jgi:hypothetical protein
VSAADATVLALARRVGHALSRLGVQDHGGDVVAALDSWVDGEQERSLRVTDERNRFITANAELGLFCVRQGYALRVLRGAVERLRAAVGERQRAEGAAAHDDTGKSAEDHAAAQLAVQAAFTGLAEALDETAEESKAAETAHQQLVAERDEALVETERLRALCTAWAVAADVVTPSDHTPEALRRHGKSLVAQADAQARTLGELAEVRAKLDEVRVFAAEMLHGPDCFARDHNECESAPNDPCEAGMTAEACAAERAACNCGVLRLRTLLADDAKPLRGDEGSDD